MEEDGKRQFQIVVTGRDGDAVNHVGAELTSQAKRLPMLANVVSTAELDRPELRVYPKTDVAADLGITTEMISEAVRVATIGDVAANLAKFDVGERQVPIRVELNEKPGKTAPSSRASRSRPRPVPQFRSPLSRASNMAKARRRSNVMTVSARSCSAPISSAMQHLARP